MPIPSPASNKQRFSIEAFTFIGEHQFVYMHCQVRICNATDPTSRCARGCLRHRGKRSLGDFKDEQFNLAEGPIMGKEEKDQQLGKTSEDSIAKIHKVDIQGDIRSRSIVTLKLKERLPNRRSRCAENKKKQQQKKRKKEKKLFSLILKNTF